MDRVGFCRSSPSPRIRLSAAGSILHTARSGDAGFDLTLTFEPPAGMRRVSAAVHAVVTWSREASEPAFQDALNCERWEVVPELVFEPDA